MSEMISFDRVDSLPAVAIPGKFEFMRIDGNYIMYLTDKSGVRYTPAVMGHSHLISGVTGLQSALDNKLSITGGNLTGALSGTTSAFSGKVRGETNVGMPTIGVSNSMYNSAPVEAYVSGSNFSAGARPGYGFHAMGSFGTYLYANSESDLRLRGITGVDHQMWHSGNARSDAQNDTRYSQIGHSHSWGDISGKPALLSGAGTATYVPRYATGGATLENSIMSVSATQFTAGGHIQAGAAGSYKQLLYGEANYGAVLFSGVSGGMYKFEYNTAGIGFTVDGVLTNAFYISRSNGSVSFPVPGSIPAPVSGLHIANKNYVDGSLANYVPTTRTIRINNSTQTLTGNLNFDIPVGVTSETDPIYIADRPGILRYLGNVPDNANLNNYNSTGFYGVASNATAGSLSNAPSNIAGMLNVQKTSSFTFQEYSEYNTGRQFFRSAVNSADISTAWKTSATEDYVNSQFTYNNVVNAIGYTPYNNSNPAGFIAGISSGMVTGALGYTPISGINYNMVTTALGYEPMRLDRTITINGWTQNLRDNPVYSISAGSGTVTQVGLVVPTGFNVLSSPVTGSGNLQFGFASGYSLVSSTDRSNWNSGVKNEGSTFGYVPRWSSTGLVNSIIYDNTVGTVQIYGNLSLMSGAGRLTATTGSFGTDLVVGGSSLDSYTIFQVNSTTKGIRFPTMSSSQRNAISGSSVPHGLIVTQEGGSDHGVWIFLGGFGWRRFITT